MDNNWLPTGNHWGLTITRERRPDAGQFVEATPKLVWHTTEGTSFDGARATLFANRDEPHFLVSVDGRFVQQFIPLNRASKSLAHPSGTAETNRAHCIQIEVCGFARDSHNWSEAKMERLAALAVLIEHRVDIDRVTHCSFQEPKRIAADHFARWSGHLGHVHVPHNDHVDPGHFRITDLFHKMALQDRIHG